MEWLVEFTNEFEQWWDTLTADEQIDIAATVELLEKRGPNLPFPYSSNITQSKHSHMRELRVQHKGKPYRVFYAFDPRRVAILLLGGKKAGNHAWYNKFIPAVDALYDQHLLEIESEQETNQRG